MSFKKVCTGAIASLVVFLSIPMYAADAIPLEKVYSQAGKDIVDLSELSNDKKMKVDELVLKYIEACKTDNAELMKSICDKDYFQHRWGTKFNQSKYFTDNVKSFQVGVFDTEYSFSLGGLPGWSLSVISIRENGSKIRTADERIIYDSKTDRFLISFKEDLTFPDEKWFSEAVPPETPENVPPNIADYKKLLKTMSTAQLKEETAKWKKFLDDFKFNYFKIIIQQGKFNRDPEGKEHSEYKKLSKQAQDMQAKSASGYEFNFAANSYYAASILKLDPSKYGSLIPGEVSVLDMNKVYPENSIERTVSDFIKAIKANDTSKAESYLNPDEAQYASYSLPGLLSKYNFNPAKPIKALLSADYGENWSIELTFDDAQTDKEVKRTMRLAWRNGKFHVSMMNASTYPSVSELPEK